MSPRMVHFGHSCQYVHEERSANSGVNDASQDKLSKGEGEGGRRKGREGGGRRGRGGGEGGREDKNR